MFKKTQLLIVSVLFTCSLWAQQLDVDYQPMQSYGELPAAFRTPIKERFNKAVGEINQKQKRRHKQDQKEFLLESNNEVDLYLKSGKVFFNDDVYRYINKVVDHLYEEKDDKGVRDKLNFYPIKFDYSNAFAFNEGVIFVNIGLIARCENEAELASVLGHEAGHYVKKHSINRHAEVSKAKRKEGEYRKKSINERTDLMSRHSKTNEIEADIYGFNQMKKSRYNEQANISSLQNLEYASAPPISEKFNKSFLEKGLVRIPKAYDYVPGRDTLISDESKKEEDEENESLTHPSIGERVEELQNLLNYKDTIGKKLFIESQVDFYRIREICRFEMCRVYLQENNLDDAFYLTASLLETYPNNVYLNRIMSLVLYRLSKLANEGGLSKYVASVRKAFPELKMTNNLLYKLNKEELNLIAIRYVWHAKKMYPNNTDIDEVCRLLLEMYTTKYKYNLNLFAEAQTFNDTLIDYFYKLKETPPEPEANKKGKTKKVARQKRGMYKFEESLSVYALSDLKEDKEFVAAFNKSVDATKDKRKYADASKDDDDEKEEGGKKKQSNQSIASQGKKKNKDKKDELSIDHFILLEPEYELSDNRKKIQRDYVANEETESNLRKTIQYCGKQSGTKIDMFAANDLKRGDVEKFNDYCVLKEFVYECFRQPENPSLTTDYKKIKEIAEKYDTRYVGILIDRGYIYKKRWTAVALPALFFFITPVLITPMVVSGFFPLHQSVLIFGVMDMQENKIVYGDVMQFDTKGRNDLFKSQFYAALRTMKGKKKK